MSTTRIRPALPIRRRRFVQAGTLSMLGLSWPAYLRYAEANGIGPARRAKSAILIWLAGGPSHLDSFDPKPQAPAEIRGEYGAVDTAVTGVRFAESLPRLAEQANVFSVIRTLNHRQGAHEPGSAYMISGYGFRPGHNFPSIGSVVGHERQDGIGNNLPAYVAIPDETVRGGGHLGPAFNPLSIPGDPNADGFRVQDLALPRSLTSDRFQRRRRLAQSVNADFRAAHDSGLRRSIDQFTEQAYEMMTSAKAQAAFELGREADAVRERYGRNTFGQRLVLARRLIEARVPFVTVTSPNWDDHRNLYPGLKQRLPAVDQGVAALLSDLESRGLLDETLVVMMGEFGRTPKINQTQGRDHWPHVFSVLIAGGGVRGGRVIGTSDATGESPQERPVSPEELFHSMYVLLGIDPEKFLPSTSGRDIQIVRGGRFISELT